MPELPEVEEVRRTLEPRLLDQLIERVQVKRADFVTPDVASIERLAGALVTRTIRHGKKLFLIAADGRTLVLHLGMSGRVDCVASASAVAKHTHVVFTLVGGSDVRLRDPRRFGGLAWYPTQAAAETAELANLGPDALGLRAEHLAHWKTGRGRIKQRLLSQKDVAGLGNIYVDEALWAAEIHPTQRVDRLRPEQIERLVQQVIEVLERSIRSGGTTLRDYRNVSDQPGRFASKLKAYGRAGKPCLRCSTTMQGTVVAGRTTVFCPGCQRAVGRKSVPRRH